MQSLVAELAPSFGTAHKISRINRDMRFARGQAPYKSHIAAGVGRHYLSISKDGLYVGTGIYMPESAALQRLRAAIDDHKAGRELASIVTSLKRKRYRVDTHERTAKPPRGYSADHPRIDLLSMKDLHAGVLLPPSALSTRKALDRVARVINETEPLSRWLQRHVE
jgi:uncharacterized protein (TIGR02453 family)